jgi:rhodanese-related sulfurtransferase
MMSKAKKTSNSPKWIWIAGGIALLVAIFLTGWVFLQPDNAPASAAQAPLPAEVSVDEAAALREGGAFMLDVRQPEEWIEYHIPGSTLIPLDQLEARLNEIPQDQEVVVVCRSGNRSQVGRDILLKGGYEQVTSMAGGLNGWRATGYEVVSGP